MDALVARLSDITSSDLWPDSWLTIPQISELLEESDFWSHPEFASWSEEGRLNWLANALATREEGLVQHPVWWQVGREYKHRDRFTQEDAEMVEEWRAEKRETAEENMAAALAGKISGPEVSFAPFVLEPEEILREADRRAEELAALLRATGIESEPAEPGEPSLESSLPSMLAQIREKRDLPPTTRAIAYLGYFNFCCDLPLVWAEEGFVDPENPPEAVSQFERTAREAEEFMHRRLQ